MRLTWENDCWLCLEVRLHEITRQRERLTARLADTDQDLTLMGEIIETCLQLLEDPHAL
jgi:hypothetical protein